VASQGGYGPPGAELQRLYDADAVDHYIAQLQAHIRDLQRQVTDAMALAQEAQAKAAATGKSEALLGRALLSAQQAADQTMADAERRADLIVAEARHEADRLLADVRADAQRIVDEAHQTVEAVFAALHAHEEPGPVPEPEAAPAAFAPPPPPSMWAAPDPSTREPDDQAAPDDERAPDDWAPPAPWEEPSDGTIVDLRPARPPAQPAPQGSHRHEPSAGADWALSLGGTGTEGPLPAPAPVPRPAAEHRPTEHRPAEHRPPPASPPRTVSRAAPESRTVTERRPTPEGRPPAAELLDRWRLARTGTTAREGEFLSRPGQLESLADGSYVSQLRGEGRHPVDPAEPPARRWLRRAR